MTIQRHPKSYLLGVLGDLLVEDATKQEIALFEARKQILHHC